MLYFDHCATTPPYEAVTETVSEVMNRYYGNPSSLHRLGVESERLMQRAREQIAGLLGADAEQIVFTSGGTESNNLAVLGAAFQYSGRGKHLITTSIEHASVYECFRHLERSGFQVTYVEPDEGGVVKPETVLAALREDTILVSVMHVNNELGTVQPIQELAKQLRDRPRALFHVDAVQSFGKLPVKPREWGVDLLSISGHKIRGPKGTGLLYKGRGVTLQPLLLGGGQEHGLRSGTENVPAIVGLAKAMRLASERQASSASYMYRLRSRLLQLLAEVPGLIINGSKEAAAPHVVNVSLPGLRSEVIVHSLEERGICVSTRSACSSGEEKPSRVLLAIGADHARASSGIRISLSADHTEQEVELLGAAFRQTIETLRRIT